MKTITSTGIEVFGLKKSANPKTLQYTLWSGRARIQPNNPYFDEYLKWDLSGNAVDHPHGNINPANIDQ